MQETFYAHGKLLLTGEYLVLKGAQALAIPTQAGQSMKVITTKGKPEIHWKSTEYQKIWFEATLSLPTFEINTTTDIEIATTLASILSEASKLNPAFKFTNERYSIETHLEFDRSWGLGSSSTLISLISQWLQCNPFKLNKIIFKGSGYDIACAQSQTPIIYQLIDGEPHQIQSSFHPKFSHQLTFIHLNRKQNTREAIKQLNTPKDLNKEIQVINSITQNLNQIESITDFCNAIDLHETTISKIIGVNPIKEQLFNDFEGSIKSLGAWGGDFILAASHLSKNEIETYFRRKGFNTIIPFNKLILK